MRRIAISISVLIFFLMALVGLATGQPPFVCALRALLGAVVSFIATSFALRWAVDVMIKAVVCDGRDPAEKTQQENTGESQE